MEMNMVRLDNKLKRLTPCFYNDFSGCSEILQKCERPYCIALVVVDGTKFAIPFRTYPSHKYCYIFSTSDRSQNSGLDFSKAVVITKEAYIGDDATISSNEYKEFINKQLVIANRFENYLQDYKKWCTNPSYYRAENALKYSSLQYFHRELGILGQ